MFCTKIFHVMSMILKTILSASAVHVCWWSKKECTGKRLTVAVQRANAVVVKGTTSSLSPFAMCACTYRFLFGGNKTSLNLILMLMPLVNWGEPE